jgi:hypothetical protein
VARFIVFFSLLFANVLNKMVSNKLSYSWLSCWLIHVAELGNLFKKKLAALEINYEE